MKIRKWAYTYPIFQIQNSNSMSYLVFDIGGTHIRCAVSKNGRDFDGAPTIVNTPATWEEAKKALESLIPKGIQFKKVCVAIAGKFDEAHTQLLSSKNLIGWEKKPLKKFIETETGADTILVNDAVAAAIGEARIGAGKGCTIVAYLTVGTGLGGARVVDGRLDDNRHGFEPGKQIIDTETGETLEDRVAGAGFIKRFGSNFVKNVPQEALDSAAHDLAVGIHNTIDYWSPDVVVLGGGMFFKPHGISLDAVKKNLTSLSLSEKVFPPILLAKFAEESGLYGALILVSNPR